MPPENITPGAQVGETHVISPTATGTVETVTPASPAPKSAEITLAELNATLGKTFPDKETALRSIVDTNSYVGRKKEDIEREVLSRVHNTEETAKLTKQVEDMRKDMFYRDNPNYAKPEVRAMIEKFGGNPIEVVAQPEFKTIFDKITGYDEVQNRKTVLESNPRIVQSRDVLTKATEAIAQSNGYRTESIENSIANAVLELAQ